MNELSSHNSIVFIDSSGRKVYVEIFDEETLSWRSIPGSITKTVIRLDNEDRVDKKIDDYVLSSIDLEETGAEGNPEHVKLSKDDVFNVISSVAEEHFQRAPVDPNWNREVEKERIVRVLDDQGVQREMLIKVSCQCFFL